MESVKLELHLTIKRLETALLCSVLTFLLFTILLCLSFGPSPMKSSNEQGLFTDSDPKLEMTAFKEDYDRAIYGEKLFVNNCASCHALSKEIIGPALLGVDKKYEEVWLKKWIKNSQQLITEGDPIAVALSNEYNGKIMPAFTTLSNDEIDAILFYLKK